MKKLRQNPSTLVLRRETLQRLTDQEVAQAAGGTTWSIIVSMPSHSPCSMPCSFSCVV